jgi:hypothetical protein
LAARRTWAGGALAGLSALVLFGCLDDRTLQPLPLTWLDTGGGQAGASEGPQAGFPGDFEAGSGGSTGDPVGGDSKSNQGGSGGTGAGTGTGGTSGSGADSGGAGKSGSPAGGTAGNAAAGAPDDDCRDLDSDGVPDCEETLVKNGSFDTGSKSWIADMDVTDAWDHQDADKQTSSGSLDVTNKVGGDVDGFTMAGAQQCLPIDEQGAYRFVGQLYIASGQGDGNGGVNLWYFNLPDCQGSILNATTKLQVTTDTWQMVYAQPVTPMGARSVAVRLVVSKPYRTPKFTVVFDNILFAKG